MVKRKILSKITAIFLVLCVSVGLVAGCGNNETAEKEVYSPELAQLVKEYENADIWDDQIGVTLTEEETARTLNYDFTIEDFSDIGALRISDDRYNVELARKKARGEQLTEKEEKKVTNFKRSLYIYIEPGVENVARAILTLREREWVFEVTPSPIVRAATLTERINGD